MSSPYKLRLAGEPPYSPAVPDPLPENSPPPPPPPGMPSVPQPTPQFRAAEEFDIAAKIEEQARADAAAESIGKAVLGGLVAAVLCIVIAGGFAALTRYWHCAFSVGIAFVVAGAVKRFGKGDDARFGFIGAGLSLLGCVGAYQLAWLIVLARQEEMGLLELLRDAEGWAAWTGRAIDWFNLLCYAISAVCGYKFSYNAVSGKY